MRNSCRIRTDIMKFNHKDGEREVTNLQIKKHYKHFDRIRIANDVAMKSLGCFQPHSREARQ